MGAIKKTLEYLALREPAQDELGYNNFEAPTYDTSYYEADDSEPVFDSVTPFPGSTALVEASQPEEEISRIVTVCPRTYNEAKPIGDAFRQGAPVIMNLTSMSEGEARRMVDFASGLIYGLNGSIERVTNRVFLLSPESVEVSEGVATTKDSVFNQG